MRTRAARRANHSALSILDEHVRTGLGNVDANAPARVSYDVAHVDVPLRAPPCARPWRAAAQLVHACAAVEARVHAALRALSTASPASLMLALVSGPSLRFPQHVVLVELVDLLAPAAADTPGAPDTPTRTARRRKISAMLERKLVRFFMEEDLLSAHALPTTRTRVLLYAPAMQVPGWMLRRGAMPFDTYVHAGADEDVPAALDAEMPRPEAPRRTRMSCGTTDLLARHGVTRTSLVARQRRQRRHGAAPARLQLRGDAPSHSLPNHWYECDVALIGVPGR